VSAIKQKTKKTTLFLFQLINTSKLRFVKSSFGGLHTPVDGTIFIF
jgi:hypothetical protein